MMSMPLFRPSELIQYLREKGLQPKKGLSQNFLIDGNILKKIVQAADVQPGDRVLEIGPGPGALTQQLLLAGAELTAVEKDQGFAEALPDFVGQEIDVRCQDIMDFDLDSLAGDSKIKVIANLPYHLTSPILAMLTPRNDLISTVTVMVQDEVARRFSAEPGGKDYSSFTVLLDFYCEYCRYAFKVGRKCFFPAPKVDSAVLHMKLRPAPELSSEEDFFKMVRQGFQQRRKMLRKSLQGLYQAAEVEAALQEMGLPETARPEVLSLEQFLQLYKRLGSD